MPEDIKSVVITGGNGFVGRYLVDEVKREWQGARLIVWDREVDDLVSGVEGVQVDVTDPKTYLDNLKEAQPDWVVHLAAVPSAAKAAEDETWARLVNIEGTRLLLQSIEQVSGSSRVLVISTADIYGQGGDTPLLELSLDKAQPRNLYAKSKWEMERIIEANFNERCIRVRPFPHIGAGQALGFVTADFASQIAAIERGALESVIKVGNLEAIRDFTDVRDVARAYRLLMELGTTGDVYHVASGAGVKISKILSDLLALSEVEIEVLQDPDRLRPADIAKLVGDASKLSEATGWQAEIPLEKSLGEILDYWRANVSAKA